jgi:hypothetical protein
MPMPRVQVFSLVCTSAVSAAACTDFTEAPAAVILDTAPLELDPARDDADDLTIRVEYTDGDGDLGGGLAEIVDCRAEDLAIRLELPPIASDAAVGEGVPISGTLDLVVADIGAVTLGSAAPAACADLGVAAPLAGEVVFCVSLIDAAGNQGPGDCTPVVMLVDR